MVAKKIKRFWIALFVLSLIDSGSLAAAFGAQPPPSDPWVKALSDSKADTLSRIEAARKMGVSKDAKRYLSTLTNALKDDNKAVRWAVVEALWDLGDPRAVPDLVEFLGKGEGYDWGKILALNALGSLKDPRAVPPLIKMLENENPFLRRSAALALVKIGDEKAIPGLIRMLKDEEGWLQRLAHLLLLEMTSGKIQGDPPRGHDAWVQWSQGQAQHLRIEGARKK